MNDVAIPAVVTELIDKLQPQLGKDAVVTGGAIVERAAGIWRSDTVVAAAIFRPATVEQVATVLRECHAVGQSVITHGGLTGLVEGAITKPTDVVLSTERLNKIESVSVVDRTMVVQSGVTLQAAQERAT